MIGEDGGDEDELHRGKLQLAVTSVGSMEKDHDQEMCIVPYKGRDPSGVQVHR